MVLRAQFSLVFDDEEVFNELIQPLKDQKELKPFTMRLFLAYYYSEAVREAVSEYMGESDNDMEETSELQEHFDAVRDSIAGWGALLDDLNMTVDEGVRKFSEMAEESGGVASQDTGFGATPFLLGSKIPSSSTRIDSTMREHDRNDRLDLLEVKVNKILELLSNNEDTNTIGVAEEVTPQVIEETKLKIDTTSSELEYSLSTEDVVAENTIKLEDTSISMTDTADGEGVEDEDEVAVSEEVIQDREVDMIPEPMSEEEESDPSEAKNYLVSLWGSIGR